MKDAPKKVMESDMESTTILDWNSVLPEPPEGPALYWRHRWPEYQERLGLPLAKGTMQNLDSAGRGPAAVVVAGKVAYQRDDLVAFLSTLPVARLSHKGTENA